jgi:hypothetical protein
MSLFVAGLTQYRTQTPFRLRQHGTYHCTCISFFALCERKNETQVEDEVPLRMILGYRVTPVNGRN